MSKNKIIEHLIVFAIHIGIYEIFYWIFLPLLPLPGLFAFAITFAFYMSLENAIQVTVKKLVSKQYYWFITEVQRILEQLNNHLNEATRYDEVSQLLFKAFDRLFKDHPFAFYIQEKDKYLLAHHRNIGDEELLALDIKREYMEHISPEELLVDNLDETRLSSMVKDKLKNNQFDAILPFRGHNQIFAFLALPFERVTFFKDEISRRLFRKIQRKAGLILENTALFLDIEKKHFETRKLIEVSGKILSSFDIKNTLDFILNSLKSLISYDAAAIFLLDDSGKKLLNTSSEGYDPDVMQHLHLKVGQGACGWVVQSKQMHVVDDIRNADHYYEIRKKTLSQISIPLIFDEDVLGVICLESNRLAFFDNTTQEVLRLFAHLAAIAIHNSRQLEVMLAKQSLEHELLHAGNVQKRLLVQQFPQLENFHVTALNIPSKIISGDLYDIIKFDEHNMGLAIGDVSGKGAPAALMMTLVLAGLRSYKHTFLTVCDVVYRLNNLLYESTIEGKYATFFYGVYSRNTGKFYYTNAGHNPPYLIKADGSVYALKKGGIVLGFLADQMYIQDEVDFQEGDMLLAYTDGITESVNRHGEEFGEERLLELVQKHRKKAVTELRTLVMNKLNEYSKDDTPADDLTIVLAKHK